MFGCFEDILGEFIGDAGIQPLEESKTATVCQGKVKQIVQCSRNLLKLLKAVSWSHKRPWYISYWFIGGLESF